MNTMNGEGEPNAARDGIVRSWLDGELALERTDVRFRYTSQLAIDGFYFSTFYGGSTAEWAPVKDESAMFDNFIISDNQAIKKGSYVFGTFCVFLCHCNVYFNLRQ